MKLFATLALASAAALTAQPAVAQTFPSRTVTLVVTYPAGGGADMMARLVAPKMAEALGQSVVIENKAGAAGQLGAASVANAAPDGHTVMLDAASFVINPFLYPTLPYDTEKAFRPIGVIARFPHVLVVTPNFEAKSAPELISMAQAKPGTINYASSGTGSAQHLAGASFIQRTKAQMTHVPYRGGGPAMNDVMGGHVPVFFANIASGLGNITGGKLRPLAIAHDKRIPAIPDVPTMAEAGVSGGLVYEWNGVFVPAGTPDAAIERLAKALDHALQSPEVRQRIEALGGDIVGGGPPAAQSFIVDQRRTIGDLIREQGIKID